MAKFNNQCNNFYKSELHEWNTLNFRSKAEIKIAEELERLGLAFMPNSIIRVIDFDGKGRNFEIDFLVNYLFQWWILEVDGDQFHTAETKKKDEERDYLLGANTGIVTFRFNALDCYLDAQSVIKEFKGRIQERVRNKPSVPPAPYPPKGYRESTVFNAKLGEHDWSVVICLCDSKELKTRTRANDHSDNWRIFLDYIKTEDPIFAKGMDMFGYLSQCGTNYVAVDLPCGFYKIACKKLKTMGWNIVSNYAPAETLATT